jgi:collagen type IV alpha-3-binding protein
VTKEQLHYARMLPGKDSVWELFAEDGEMRMYRREEIIDGMVVDPLKALHQVRGKLLFRLYLDCAVMYLN